MSIMLPPDSDGNNRSTRSWRANDLSPEDMAPYAERFHRSYTAEAASECWIWGGPRGRSGYGYFCRSSRMRPASWLAHRVAWVLSTGRSLTDDMTIDHLCHERGCVNPSHLEAVTMAENARRARLRANGGVPLSDEERRARAAARQRRWYARQAQR